MREVREPGNTKRPRLNKASFWHYRVFTMDGKSRFGITFAPNRALFGNTPPVNRKKASKSLYRTPKVLACSTRTESDEIEKVIPEICSKIGLPKVRLHWSIRIGGFWERFFGRRNYLDAKTLDVPKVIFTTGTMRNNDGMGGENVEVDERLQLIADDWKIQIVFLAKSKEGTWVESSKEEIKKQRHEIWQRIFARDPESQSPTTES